MSRKIEQKCVVCGKSFFARLSDLKRGWGKYCSVNCANKMRAPLAAKNRDQCGAKNPNWRGGTKTDKILNTERKRQYKLRNPEKAKCHGILTNALRTGLLVRQPCRVCGSVDVDGHHEDYSKPLEVQWLCRKHHRELHDDLKYSTKQSSTALEIASLV